MRTTISLPDPVHENAKLKASERGITLSEFVSEALVCHLNARFENPKDAPPFRLITVDGGTVNPDIDLNRTSAIIHDDDVEWYKAKMDRTISG